jgi:hypothetical protein
MVRAITPQAISVVTFHDIIGSGTSVDNIADFNNLPVGNIGFSGAYPLEIKNLDSYAGSLDNAATVSASFGNYILQDDSSISSSVEVNGYGEKDSIEITGVSTSDITFMSYSNNVEISVNNNGAVSLIVLKDILHSDDIVYDINSFNALNVEL